MVWLHSCVDMSREKSLNLKVKTSRTCLFFSPKKKYLFSYFLMYLFTIYVVNFCDMRRNRNCLFTEGQRDLLMSDIKLLRLVWKSLFEENKIV